jgi:site-specific recombinase XerD
MTCILDQIDAFIADLERRKFRQNTLIAYRSDVMMTARHLLKPLEQITLDDIEAFLISSSRSQATAARRAASLKRLFGWAKKQGLCAHNPLADREPMHAAVRRLPRPVHNQSDLSAIDTAIVVAPKPYRLLFTILRETDMRVGEVLGLGLNETVLCIAPALGVQWTLERMLSHSRNYRASHDRQHHRPQPRRY